jgi:hypothetical protein
MDPADGCRRGFYAGDRFQRGWATDEPESAPSVLAECVALLGRLFLRDQPGSDRLKQGAPRQRCGLRSVPPR